MSPDTTDFEHLLEKPNALAVSYDAEADQVTVYVSQKLAPEDLDDEDRVDLDDAVQAESRSIDVEDARMGGEYDGLAPLVVPQNGQASDEELPHFVPQGDRHDKHRPVLAGVSEINAQSTAATAGPYPVKVTAPKSARGQWADDVEAGDIVRLSNCHVYARSGAAEMGEPVIQPSPYDGGSATDSTGELVGYLPLEDGVTADVAARSADEEHDAIHPHELSETYPSGVVRGPYDKLNGAQVTKTGRTTGVTSGQVREAGASVRVEYPDPVGTVTLRDQLLTASISDGGDSGSPVYTTDGRLVGLVFAGSPQITAVSPAALIESNLGVRFLTEHPDVPLRERVGDILRDRYNSEHVDRVFEFSETSDRVDFLVDPPAEDREGVLAVETEDHPVAFTRSVGQTLVHKIHQPIFGEPITAVLVLPDEHGIDNRLIEGADALGITVCTLSTFAELTGDGDHLGAPGDSGGDS